MKKPILFLLTCISSLLLSQQDTLVLPEEYVIPCRILRVYETYLSYHVKGKADQTILKQAICYYSKNGVRHAGGCGKVEVPIKNEVSNYTPPQNNNGNEQMDYMRNCLIQGHAEFSNGVKFKIISFMPITVGALAMSFGYLKPGGSLIGVGAVLNLIGTILIIDAHKWQERAGLGVVNSPSGVGVRYRFK